MRDALDGVSTFPDAVGTLSTPTRGTPAADRTMKSRGVVAEFRRNPFESVMSYFS
jgi:hypothetical protein